MLFLIRAIGAGLENIHIWCLRQDTANSHAQCSSSKNDKFLQSIIYLLHNPRNIQRVDLCRDKLWVCGMDVLYRYIYDLNKYSSAGAALSGT